MKVVIVEDEALAVEGLVAQLKRVDPAVEILISLDSVKTAVQWFRENAMPDMAFFDIHLGDGLSFEIFDRVSVTCPVIFTTAYDAYALRAFKVNSIDYLLKPVSTADLERAFKKFLSFRQLSPDLPVASVDLEILRQILLRTAPTYKSRFMVKIGDRLTAFGLSDIEYFYGENKIVWLRTKTGRKYIVDYTLEELEDLLDPQQFFRLNRKFITPFDAIKDVLVYTNSRLKILLREPPDKEEILVSREKARRLYGMVREMRP